MTEETIPIQLPQPATETPAPQTYVPPTAAELAESVHSHSYNIGGTVYHPKAGPNRSRVTFSSSSDHPPVELWSSIDWNLLTPGGFTTPQGENYSLMIMLSFEDIAQEAQADPHYQPPVIPSFPNGAATYRIISGPATPDVIAALNALHAVHDREYQSLTAQLQQREEQRFAAEAAALLPKAPPADIITQYREMTPEELINR